MLKSSHVGNRNCCIHVRAHGKGADALRELQSCYLHAFMYSLKIQVYLYMHMYTWFSGVLCLCWDCTVKVMDILWSLQGKTFKNRLVNCHENVLWCSDLTFQMRWNGHKFPYYIILQRLFLRLQPCAPPANIVWLGRASVLYMYKLWGYARMVRCSLYHARMI